MRGGFWKTCLKWLAAGLAGSLAVWWVVSYLVLPAWWRQHALRHPGLEHAPTLSFTADGIPGDPLNLFLVTEEKELASALMKEGWYPADPVTLESSLRIAEDAVLRRPYDDAPVSPLILFGRKQDLAFEKPVGHDPRERHHVRFWRSPLKDDEGRTAWWGAATFDRSVGLSRDTGEITHHIAPEIDKDRDLVMADLQAAGFAMVFYRDAFQKESGKNGGGDPWRTDGRLGIAVRGGR